MFSTLLKALSLIPSLLPIIAAFVQQADQLLASAPGTSKFASVLVAVNAYIAKLETDTSVIAELQKLVEPLIEGAVAFLHSPTAVAAAAAPSAAASVVTHQAAAPAAEEAAAVTG